MGVFDDDVTAVLADLKAMGETVTVTIGNETVDGIKAVLEQEEVAGNGMRIKRSLKTVLIVKGGLGGLATKAAITVGGNAGIVHDFEPEGEDDRMTQIVYVET